MSDYRAEFFIGDPDPDSPYHEPCWYAWLPGTAGPSLAGVGGTWEQAKADADATLAATQARQIADTHLLTLIDHYEEREP